jgi:hypothetical protein
MIMTTQILVHHKTGFIFSADDFRWLQSTLFGRLHVIQLTVKPSFLLHLLNGSGWLLKIQSLAVNCEFGHFPNGIAHRSTQATAKS